MEGEGCDWLREQHSRPFDIDAQCQARGNREGWTSLFYAATSGDDMVVEYLLTRRADVNARDAMGNRSLTYAHGPAIRKILRSLMTREESRAETWKLHEKACAEMDKHKEALEEVSHAT